MKEDTFVAQSSDLDWTKTFERTSHSFTGWGNEWWSRLVEADNALIQLDLGGCLDAPR